MAGVFFCLLPSSLLPSVIGSRGVRLRVHGAYKQAIWKVLTMVPKSDHDSEDLQWCCTNMLLNDAIVNLLF
ncbi:uncharacterized protein FPRO_01348 [Fusarium proliferatum ET1]|uniref:Uncharacterized protein n=1 Tax=Fusarium proliferatum (strain ET1) TaxID=1227346 RepID=A0A1L7V182_FUSPR|nr:uncharacterized protein FPRO_01348 [Fusarium proliferatum ET1]CZR34317.1 uncharacterized protein FPRO_01348 [Fusarium proliferatum ET1]